MICFEFLSLTQSYPALHLRFMVNKFRFRTRQRICRDVRVYDAFDFKAESF